MCVIVSISIMNAFNEASLIGIVGAALNIINTVTNLYWSNKLRGVQVNKELMADLREAVQEKDLIINELHRKKNEYKHQYLQLHAMYQQLLGKLHTYDKLAEKISTKP